jgi:hypothetical protein
MAVAFFQLEQAQWPARCQMQTIRAELDPAHAERISLASGDRQRITNSSIRPKTTLDPAAEDGQPLQH